MNLVRKAIRICIAVAVTLCGFDGAVASAPDQVFDSYGVISWEDEKARLDNFAAHLQLYPNDVGYILVYAGRRACRGEAQRRAVRAKKYVVEHRGIAWHRVIWRDEGHLEEMRIILQPVPRGMSLPYPLYSFRLPNEDVQVIDCPVRSRNRRRRAGS